MYDVRIIKYSYSDFVFLSGGLDVVFKIALVLLGDHKELIKQCNSFESINDFLKLTLPSMSYIQMERIFKQVGHYKKVGLLSGDALRLVGGGHGYQSRVVGVRSGIPSVTRRNVFLYGFNCFAKCARRTGEFQQIRISQ